MIITATELEENFDKYFDLVSEGKKEIIIITNNGDRLKLTPVKEAV